MTNCTPIYAENIVTTSQPLATQAGLNILRKGGNAIDAVLAAAITLTVVEPCSNGVGGDAFAIGYINGELCGLNASGKSPKGWTPSRFKGREKMPMWGWDSVTVPGAVSAWAKLSDRFGVVSFEELFVDAIRYAQDGFLVGPVTARAWQAAEKLYTDFPDFGAHFLPCPKPGEEFVRRELATTLQSIAQSKGESFYRGSLAEQIAEASNKGGGALTAEDLSLHRADWVTPLQLDYRGYDIQELPPNGQGLAALIALGILRHFDTKLDTSEFYHVQIEAMKIAIRASFDHISDPNSMKQSIELLLDSVSLARAAAGIGQKACDLPPIALPVSYGTVCLSAADCSGNMISFIQSNYKGFGSGVIIPGTGISMHNRGYGFTLQDGHPNEVGPGKRPYQTIIPGFVTENGFPKLSYGVMGGHMQHQGHVQMVMRILDHNQNPQAAADAPRWLVNPDFSISVESGFSADIAADLEQRGHNITMHTETGPFGGAQLILKTQDGYVAGSDHRKEGQAAGF